MSQTVGSIDERGILKGFNRKGFTLAKCLLELEANARDAILSRVSVGGKIAYTVNGTTSITMRDNGVGMDRDDLANMFALHRENHASDTSRGVSGVGAKPALSILSERQPVSLYTRKAGGECLRVDIPWDAIHAEGRYTGKVTVSTMNPEEAADFGAEPGTLIRFPYTEDFHELLKANFEPYDEAGILSSPLDRIAVVFGKDAASIACTLTVDSEPVQEIVYCDYFGSVVSEYYQIPARDTIEHWYSPKERKDRFFWNTGGEKKECRPAGRGFAKEPTPVVTGTHGYTLVGTYVHTTVLRKDPAVFGSDAAPSMPDSGAAPKESYLTQFVGSDEPFWVETKLVRNNQLIGTFPQPDFKNSSVRGNPESRFLFGLVQSELSYNPVSSQDNHQDRVCNIQENKNQHNGGSMPLNLSRLVAHIRRKRAEELRDYMQGRGRSVVPTQPLVAVSVPATVSAVEELALSSPLDTISVSSEEEEMPLPPPELVMEDSATLSVSESSEEMPEPIWSREVRVQELLHGITERGPAALDALIVAMEKILAN